MRPLLPRLALAAALAVALTGCASATGPSWTYAPTLASSAPVTARTVATTPAASTAPMAAQAIEIEAFDLGFKPAAITVSAPGGCTTSRSRTPDR